MGYTAVAVGSCGGVNGPGNFASPATFNRYEPYVVSGLFAVAVAALPPVVGTLLSPRLGPPSLVAGALACFWAAAAALDGGRCRIQREAEARKVQLEELSCAREALLAGEAKAEKAEKRRLLDAERLATLRGELDALGAADERTRRLARGDEVSTLAAERAFYEGQAAAAREQCVAHSVRVDELNAELPSLRARAEGLEEALSGARSEARQAQSDRQSVDTSAAHLNEQVEQLREQHKIQQDELKRYEEETRKLEESADRTREERLAEAQALLRTLDREAMNGSRTTRWYRGAKKQTESTNETLRAALEERDRERDGLLEDVEQGEAVRSAAEGELQSVRVKLDNLEEEARVRERAQREAARQRERQEKQQSSATDLQAEVREARAASQHAEQDANEAEKEAKQRGELGEAKAKEVHLRCQQHLRELQQAAETHRAEVADAEIARAALDPQAEKIAELKAKLAESECVKAQLRLELQRVKQNLQEMEGQLEEPVSS